MLLETFLRLHGYELCASDEELVATIRALAASDITDSAFTTWVRGNARPGA